VRPSGFAFDAPEDAPCNKETAYYPFEDLLQAAAAADKSLERMAKNPFLERRLSQVHGLRWQYSTPTASEKKETAALWREAKDPQRKDVFESWFLTCNAISTANGDRMGMRTVEARIRIAGESHEVIFVTETLEKPAINVGTRITDLTEYQKTHRGMKPGDGVAMAEDMLQQEPPKKPEPSPPLPDLPEELLRPKPPPWEKAPAPRDR
jgi:hypothetical protein